MSELTVDNLSFSNRGPYSFSLKEKQILCLSGASGAGKSFLLRALADLEPHSGDILLNGRSYLTFSGAAWRKKVMYLPAESQWWNETVQEHFDEKVDEELLETLGFELEVLSWQVSRLSSGEKQRLAILRVLQNRPEILLLDEPTASLDPKNIDKVEIALTSYLMGENASAIWVSHDPNQIARVSQLHGEILPGGRLEFR